MKKVLQLSVFDLSAPAVRLLKCKKPHTNKYKYKYKSMQIQINTNTNQCKYKSIQIQINTNANTNMSQLRVFDLYAPAVRLLKCLTGEHARNPNKDKYKFKFTEQILVNKSDKSDHPNQQEPWCFVEVVNRVGSKAMPTNF